MVKYIITACCVLLLRNTALAQQDSLQQQINNDVWKPFIAAFSANDNTAFSRVHSRDITRVIQDDKHIMGYEEYFRPVPDSLMTSWKMWKKQIELRFIQRIAAAGRAFETGYYKTTSTNTTTGEKRVGYGKFHVLLRTENGVWKILMDADAHENTNEEIFLSAAPLK